MSHEPVGQRPASEPEGAMRGLESLTEEVLPALITRLRASRLGELEVRSDGWRIRLRRDLSVAGRGTAPAAAATVIEAHLAGLVGSVARSPGVGYFTPVRGLVVGVPVQAGDLLGTVDVLGIAQDVSAPADGLVAVVLVEEGQAVEYGQALVQVDPLELEAALAPEGGPAASEPGSGR